jgi:hypothetical protein
MHRALLPLLAAAALVPVASPAQAAPWSAPQTVSAPHTFAGPLATAMAQDGTLVAAWPWQDGVDPKGPSGAAAASRPPLPSPNAAGAPATSAFGPERPAPAGLVDVVAYGHTRTLALSQQELSGRPGATGALRYRLRVAAGTLAGGFGAPRTLVTAPVLGRAQIAADARGSVLICWIEASRAGGRTRRIVRAIQRRDGRYGAPFTLVGTGRSDIVTAAASSRGDQAIAFVREGRVLARVRRAGHHWGSLFTVARAQGPTKWQLVLGIDERGQVRLVWRRHQLNREGAPGRSALEGTAMLVGRGRFSPAQTIQPDGAGAPALAQTAGGWGVATTLATPDGPRPVLYRTLGAGTFATTGIFAAPAQRGLRGVDVTFSAVAGTTIAWIQPIDGQGGDGQVRAASLPSAIPNPAFGPVENAGPAESAHEVRLAPDPRAAQPVAVWTARPSGSGPGIPTTQVETVVRSAVRTP